MSLNKRNGRRELRERRFNRRQPDLGYYIVVTDTAGTERVYFNGLRDSIEEKYKDRLIIKVKETNNRNMIDDALELASKHPQYAEPWIVFDKDKNKNFDKIIECAKDAGINVAWSNPCIEIWFHAYFGSMPNCSDSVNCVHNFKKEYFKNVGHEYNKADKDLYQKLFQNGDEDGAIKNAKNRMDANISNGNKTPSDMVACTNLHSLVDKIRKKIK